MVRSIARFIINGNTDLRENSTRTHFRLVALPALIAFAILRLTCRRSALEKGSKSGVAIISKSTSHHAQVVQYGRRARSTADSQAMPAPHNGSALAAEWSSMRSRPSKSDRKSQGQ